MRPLAAAEKLLTTLVEAAQAALPILHPEGGYQHLVQFGMPNNECFRDGGFGMGYEEVT